MANPDPNEIPNLEWSTLSESQKNVAIKGIISSKRWKFATFSLGSIFLSAQPLLSEYYKNAQRDREVEVAKMERVNESNSALQKIVLDNLLSVSRELTSLKSENESLKSRIAELESQLNGGKK